MHPTRFSIHLDCSSAFTQFVYGMLSIVENLCESNALALCVIKNQPFTMIENVFDFAHETNFQMSPRISFKNSFDSQTKNNNSSVEWHCSWTDGNLVVLPFYLLIRNELVFCNNLFVIKLRHRSKQVNSTKNEIQTKIVRNELHIDYISTFLWYISNYFH